MSKLRAPVGQHDHILGKPGAEITLVEYGDYECSHCGHAYPLIKKLTKEFNNDLLFVFRNFPMQESHPNAMIAAQAAEAAGIQNKFWDMHDLIFEHQDELDENNLIYFAETLNLDVNQFQNDLHSQNIISKIESDFESGIRSGVNGTPTFFINDQRLDSYDESYESLADAVRNAENE
jgi:protein-disulfide isomerase